MTLSEPVLNDGTIQVVATYTHHGGEQATDSFTFTVSDGDLVSSETTALITVVGVNDLLTLQRQKLSVTLHEDSGEENPIDENTGLPSPEPVPFALTLTATDSDSSSLTWSISGAATNGVASIASPNGSGDATDENEGNQVAISYLPVENFPGAMASGADSFVVTVTDGEYEDAITVSVTVEQINDLPTWKTSWTITSSLLSRPSAPPCCRSLSSRA